MARVKRRRLQDGWGRDRQWGRKGGAVADETFMMSCATGAWSWGGGGGGRGGMMGALREACQRGMWKDTLQSERPVALEGFNGAAQRQRGGL